MDVPRLLIWGVRERICFMRRESWDRLDLFLEEQSEFCSSFEIPGVVIDVFQTNFSRTFSLSRTRSLWVGGGA